MTRTVHVRSSDERRGLDACSGTIRAVGSATAVHNGKQHIQPSGIVNKARIDRRHTFVN
jgi:hypothetical protein